MKKNLQLIEEVDGFPYLEKDPELYLLLHEELWTLQWEDEEGTYPIGYMLDRVVQELLQTPVGIKGEMDFNPIARTVRILRDIHTEEARTLKMSQLAGYWRELGMFSLSKSWRGEAWPVYGRKGELLFSVERAALGLLGAMRYGVHMVAYVKDESAPHGIKLWIPRRAANKSTFPSMLDNTVAGGLCTGEDPFECLIREADEEASLPDGVVRSRSKFTGRVTYIYITDEKHIGESGFIYPECQWVYELELPADVIPQPKDGEVESFSLADVPTVTKALANGDFKPNCALCVIDFFIRRGILNEENEPSIAEIQQRIHRELPFPGPHQS